LKCVQLRIVLLDPLRTIPFEFANQRRHVDGAAQTTQNMHMIGHAANHDGRTLLLVANPGQIGVSPFPEGFVYQERLAFLRGKDEVHVDLR